MKTDSVKLWQTFAISIVVLVGAFYALFLSPFAVSELITGAVIGWVTLALNSIYADAASTRTSRQQQAAYDKGVSMPPPTPIVCPYDQLPFPDHAAFDAHMASVHPSGEPIP